MFFSFSFILLILSLTFIIKIDDYNRQKWARFLKPREIFTIGDLEIEVLSLPGHVDHQIGYFIRDHGTCFTGDELVPMGVGWSFPIKVGSSPSTEAQPLTTKLSDKHMKMKMKGLKTIRSLQGKGGPVWLLGGHAMWSAPDFIVHLSMDDSFNQPGDKDGNMLKLLYPNSHKAIKSRAEKWLEVLGDKHSVFRSSQRFGTVSMELATNPFMQGKVLEGQDCMHHFRSLYQYKILYEESNPPCAFAKKLTEGKFIPK